MPDQDRYNIDLSVMHGPLEVVDVPGIVAAGRGKWWNRSLVRVNDSVVRLGRLEGGFHWHRHEDDDEFFFVLEGRLFIDVEDRVLELGPGQGTVVPRGLRHRPRAPSKTVVLMVETSGIVPTGTG